MDGYAVVSRMYDLALEPLNAPLRARARRLCPTEPDSVVLDIGCGTGAALAEYVALGCRVIGLDPSPAMLARARQRLGPDADLRQVTGGTLPVDAGCADVALISLVLHSVPRSEARMLLGEAARALAPGGRILITDFGTDGLRFPRGYATRGLSAVAEVLAGPGHTRNCVDYLRSGGLRTLLPEAGLRATIRRPTAGGSITITVAEPDSSAA